MFFEENGSHRHTALLPIDPDGLYPLLEAIQSDSRRPFTTENLVQDFGPSSVIAKAAARELWNHLAICLTKLHGSRKVEMLFKEWRKLFAQATSLGKIGRARIDDYLLSIGLTRPLDYTKALFVLHTYNALLLGWPLFMVTIVLGSALWGVVTGEWKKASRRARVLMGSAVGVLVVAIIVLTGARTSA